MATDPNFSSVILLAHCDGANGGTTINDFSNAGQTFTFTGNANTSTAQTKFGPTSLAFDGVGDRVSSANANYAMGTGDWTIEFWIYMVAGGHGDPFARILEIGAVNTQGSFAIYATPGSPAGDVAAQVYNSGAYAGASLGGSLLSNATWHHFAVTCASNTIQIWMDGVATGASAARAASMVGTALYLGNESGLTASFNGYIDEVRITKGVARYSGAFTPPTQAFPDNNRLAASFSALNASACAPGIVVSMQNMSGVMTSPPTISGAMLPLTMAGSAPGIVVSMGSLTATGAGSQNAYLVAAMQSLTATMAGTGGMVFSAALIAPAPELSSVLINSSVLTAAFLAPAATLASTLISPAIITAALIGRAPRLSSSLLVGGLFTSALSAPAPTLVASGYPAYIFTAALVAPAPRLGSLLYVPVVATYQTWVYNTRKGALTSYGPEFAFNSFARFNGQNLACGSTGIVVLGTQGLDNAAPIDAIARTGAESFASSYHKRVPRIYVSGEFPGDMIFRTITSEGGTRSYALPANGATDLQQRRVPVGRGPKSRFWQFEVENSQGSDFAINDMIVYPVMLRRRVQ